MAKIGGPRCALVGAVFLVCAWMSSTASAGDLPHPKDPTTEPPKDRQAEYRALRQRIAVDRRLQARAWARTRGRKQRRQFLSRLEQRLLVHTDEVMRRWIGTRWGLGPPQTRRPHQGKVNCGTFVAVVLRDAGFKLWIWRFQLQSGRRGMMALTPRYTRRYFHRTPMKEFLAKVRKMGPGLFFIGLDFHVGFLRLYEDGRLRFIHASWITKDVVDEPAETAIPIVTSRYRALGKILQPNLLRAWLKNKRIVGYGRR
jgi:hypothetical protein